MTVILHISRMNFLSNKAHVYTTAKTCEAMAIQPELKVILLSSDNSLVGDKKKESFFLKHNIENKFDIVSLKSIANVLKGSNYRFINWLETIFANFSILNYVFKHKKEFDILYFRDTSLFVPILILKYLYKVPIFMEIHAVLHKKHGQFLNNYFAKISDGVIAISYGLKEYYEKFNKKIIVSFCAASEPERFKKIPEDSKSLRKILNLPQDKIILMYSGNLFRTGNFDSYGIEDIVNAMKYLDDSYLFVGIGKKGNEVRGHEELAKKIKVDNKVLFLPWVEKQEVYRYWKSADVLLLPAAGATIGNSPTKMFEYLVSGKVIVSARTRAIEEVLEDGVNALLVTNYKNGEEWAKAIRRATQDKELSNRLIRKSLEDGKKYTWDNRGKKIGEFIKETIPKV